ncbi:acyl carrier protein [Streptomyces sp. NPDC059568]|uniref:acyl carrier protein n=1 Tax=Streptomyces sp. NPDC059568 TaxID=3346868 RepID=UPI0036934D36
MPTSSGEAITAVTQHRWEAALGHVRADALDCLQTSMALIAEHAYGAGAHLVLGCHRRLGAGRTDGITSVLRPPAQRLREASDLLGLRTSGQWSRLDGSATRRLYTGPGPLYVVADAYDLPWLPYAGHQHMEHGFLLEAGEDGWTVVDAYHNDTAWGPARPGAWTVTAGLLDRALGNGASVADLRPAAAAPALDTAAVIAGNAARARAGAPEIEHYITDVRAQLDRPGAAEQLVLDIWLLGREQLLHTAWLAEHAQQPRAGAEARDRAAAWRQLAAQSYVALRRARRGTPMSAAVVDGLREVLYADMAATARLAPAPDTPEAAPADPHGRRDPQDLRVPGGPGGVSGLRETVVGELSTVLGLDGPTVAAATALRDLPGFNSFRLVDVIDRVEARLGVQVPGRISAKDLHDVDSLCGLFAAGTVPADGKR